MIDLYGNISEKAFTAQVIALARWYKWRVAHFRRIALKDCLGVSRGVLWANLHCRHGSVHPSDQPRSALWCRLLKVKRWQSERARMV